MPRIFESFSSSRAPYCQSYRLAPYVMNHAPRQCFRHAFVLFPFYVRSTLLILCGCGVAISMYHTRIRYSFPSTSTYLIFYDQPSVWGTLHPFCRCFFFAFSRLAYSAAKQYTSTRYRVRGYNLLSSPRSNPWVDGRWSYYMRTRVC